jgi:hypothetical protein
MYKKLQIYLFFKWRLDLTILMRANPLLGPLEGVGPENIDFLSPNGTKFACCHIRAQKGLNFQSPTLPVALEIDLSASKSLRPAPYKQQVRQ